MFLECISGRKRALREANQMGDVSFSETSLPEQLSDWLKVASAISWLMWILGLGF